VLRRKRRKNGQRTAWRERAQADVLMVVPVVCPLVFTTGRGAGAGAGSGGVAFFAFSDGRSTTCLVSCGRAGAAAGAGALFDTVELVTAMVLPLRWWE
jgi:hypothetical protein